MSIKKKKDHNQTGTDVDSPTHDQAADRLPLEKKREIPRKRKANEL